MYIRLATLRFPPQAKVDVFILMMKGLFSKTLKNKTLQQEQITIKTGDSKLVRVGFYNSEDDFNKTGNKVKNVFGFYKVLDDVFEWQDGTIVSHWKIDQ